MRHTRPPGEPFSWQDTAAFKHDLEEAEKNAARLRAQWRKRSEPGAQPTKAGGLDDGAHHAGLLNGAERADLASGTHELVAGAADPSADPSTSALADPWADVQQQAAIAPPITHEPASSSAAPDQAQDERAADAQQIREEPEKHVDVAGCRPTQEPMLNTTQTHKAEPKQEDANGRSPLGPAQSERPATPAEAKEQIPAKKTQLSYEELVSYLPLRKYIHLPTRELWVPESVNACLPKKIDISGQPISPAQWLDKNRAVHQMAWVPGAPMIIEDSVIELGGCIAKSGNRIFNLYRPPSIVRGEARAAVRWRDHVRTLYPDEAEHIERWLAFKIQYPAVKINHALVLGGGQGIGKDTLLEPAKTAVGPWNWQEIGPASLVDKFNGWLKSVIVRLSEMRDPGESRFSLYEHCKVLTVTPPDVVRVNEKNLREYYVHNVFGLIITANNKLDLFLPPDDRRHYVAWSTVAKEEPGYFVALFHWYEQGGVLSVIEYLRTLNLDQFNPKAPPPRTPAWEAIVLMNNNPEDCELEELLETKPPVIVIADLLTMARERQLDGLADFLTSPKTRRVIPARLERVGYFVVPNKDAENGTWRVRGRRAMVYGRRDLSHAEHLAAIRQYEYETRF